MTAPKRIPILDLSPELEALKSDIMAAIDRVVMSGRFILGPEVTEFEAEIAQYLGVRHAIGCNSGTDAIVLGLRALDIGPGDEVITTPFTFFATAEGISAVGATPVFVDIEPDSFNLDVAQVEACITSRTKAILPVHLFGHATDMGRLLEIAERHGLVILEDVAQAIGGKYRDRPLGTIGQVGAFSFFPSKNLGALGDGGLVTTDDDAIADRVRMLRAHGSRRKYQNEELGYNSRLDALQAAILRIKLPYLDAWNDGRRRAADSYAQLLPADLPISPPTSAPYAHHVYHQYTVRVTEGNRDQVAEQLDSDGISTMVYYPVPVHQLPVYADRQISLPVAEKAAREVLSLPIGPSLADSDIRRVAQSLQSATAHRKAA